MSGCDGRTPYAVLAAVKPELSRQGHGPDGPHVAWPGGEQYLTLDDGRRVRAWRERGSWRLYVFTPMGWDPALPAVWYLTLTSTASPDGSDFPGEPV